MTIITPHADDEALFMGEIVHDADKIVLLSDSGGNAIFRSNHPEYGRDRSAKLKSLYPNAAIFELKIEDSASLPIDLEPFALRLADWISFPLITTNADGHPNHEQAYTIGRMLARMHNKPLLIAWAYDAGLKTYGQPPVGTPITKHQTTENLRKKNVLLQVWSAWFKANYPTRWNPLFPEQFNRHDVLSEIEA